MADAALGAAQWVVAKALAPVAGTVLEAWGASRNFGLNIEALSTELMRVQATLERAATKELDGPATEKLLQKLRDSAHDAEDLLDELDYFRIHDGLHGTYEAADERGEGSILDLVRDARATANALGKQLASLSTHCFGANAGHPRQHVKCCAWQHGGQRSRGESSSAQNNSQADQVVSGCMPKLGKLLPCSSSPHPLVDDDDHGNARAQETPKPEFNRVDLSQRMKDTVEQLKLVNKDVRDILQSCGAKISPDIALGRPVTTAKSTKPKLYGRDSVMNSIIHDIIKCQYSKKGLTVLPVVGPGGMGKTTLIQHIYHNPQVQNHFLVKIWICVSLNFNLGKVLEEIKCYTPRVESEKECSTTEELIEQRLKSKRFLLVLDDIWQISNRDDWEKLLFILGQSQEMGCIILVTTRFQAIADQVKKNEEPKQLHGLEPKEFRDLFLAFVFGDGQCPINKQFLLETGDKIMEKLKGSPLAAKTVGSLLSKSLSRPHWKRVLESKQWAKETDGIMDALKLSYDFLPFHLQRCFSYSALFPEDYHFRSHELINLWIGLDILKPDDQNLTFEEIVLNYLDPLVIHGFFREEEMYGVPRYVMHDLLHELALKVTSHECLSLRLPNVGSLEIEPSTRHLSISIDNLGEYNGVSGENFKNKLEELKTRLKVEHLQTLMLFGEMDESFAKIFGDSFEKTIALRVLYLPDMMYPVESVLHKFSELIHLRCLCLGTNKRQLCLPLNISKFYHLRILDLQRWHGSRHLPSDMNNLDKLCHIHAISGEIYSDIYNVGKLKLLQELKVFRAHKNSEGFEPQQLEPLTKLRELGMYNLEKIHNKKEAGEAKLIEKNYLRRLTLDWYSKRSVVKPDVEADVLEGLQPNEDLQVLCIRGHGGSTCPTWLGVEFAVNALQSLCLDGVSWEVFPTLWKASDLHELRLNDIAGLKEFIIEKSFCMLIKLELTGLGGFEKWVFQGEQESSLGGDSLLPGANMFPCLQVLIIRGCPKLLMFPLSNWFPKLQKLEIHDCPEFSSVIPISWMESLRHVNIERVKLLEEFVYSKSSHGVELKIHRQSRFANVFDLRKRRRARTSPFISRGDLHSFDQVLDFDKETCIEKLTLESCPRLELKHLRMLTSLKKLVVYSSEALIGPLGGEGDVEWHLPVEHIWINGSNGNSGKELTELLPHLPRLSKLAIENCKNIKKLVVGVDLQQKKSATSEMEQDEITTTEVEEDDGMLLFRPHLCDSLRELLIWDCPELVLVDPPTLVPGGGWLQDLRYLQRLSMRSCPKFLSTFSGSRHIFPSSLRHLSLRSGEGMGTLEPLSNLSSLVSLTLDNCGEDLKCHGLSSLLTTTGQLNELQVTGSTRFFAGLGPNPRRSPKDVEGGEEQQTPNASSTPWEFCTDDIAGLLAAPVCSFLSPSLTKLELWGRGTEGIERFSKEQEDALQLLSSLQQLTFLHFKKLQQLPAGLCNLTSLEKLFVSSCPAVSSLPNDGLPESLKELNVYRCGNKELTQQCRGLVGNIPKVEL